MQLWRHCFATMSEAQMSPKQSVSLDTHSVWRVHQGLRCSGGPNSQVLYRHLVAVRRYCGHIILCAVALFEESNSCFYTQTCSTFELKTSFPLASKKDLIFWRRCYLTRQECAKLKAHFFLFLFFPHMELYYQLVFCCDLCTRRSPHSCRKAVPSSNRQQVNNHTINSDML